MKTWHVVLRAGEGDSLAPAVDAGNDRLVRFIAGEVVGSSSSELPFWRVWDELHGHQLEALQTTADLLRIAGLVYAADLRLPRRSGYNQWTRQIVLYIPVCNSALWTGGRKELESFLAFLTGDRWSVEFRDGGLTPPPATPKRLGRYGRADVEAVCLFSGGLDSFIGAADLLHYGDRIALVSHNAKGPHRFSSPRQDLLAAALRKHFGKDRLTHFKFSFDPPPVESGLTGRELTQRSRSFLFLSLGLLVANGLGEAIPLVVPENGFISLNVPLTPARSGSLSTRTTHPHTLAMFQNLLRHIGLANEVKLPYRFVTKGAMLQNASDTEFVYGYAHETISCAHPNPFKHDPERPQNQCGYCVPCIIRRAAMARVGLDDPEHYRYDVVGEPEALTKIKNSDLRAFEVALIEAERGIGLRDVLRAGPLSTDSATEIDQYVDVYHAGLTEVAKFLGRTAPRRA